MLPKTIIHLMSGGLDSTACLRMLMDEGHSVHCLLVNYRQPHGKELWFAEHTCKRWNVECTTLDLPKLGGLTNGNWIVPNRNALLISLAVSVAMKAGADTVTIGCNADDAAMFPDCREPFLDAMDHAATLAETRVEVCAPFLTWSKARIARYASDVGIRTSDVWWCYRGGDEPCGECPACRKMQ